MRRSDTRSRIAAISVVVLLLACLGVARRAAAIAEQVEPEAARAEAPAAPPSTEPAPPPSIEPAPPPPPELAPAVEPIPTEPGSWRPPARAPDPKHAKDWVLLKSGELLRGEIEHIRDEEMYFDSDEL